MLVLDLSNLKPNIYI